MNHIEDVVSDLEMHFNQLLDLLDLMIENDNTSTPNLMTLRHISESGLSTLKALENNSIL